MKIAIFPVCALVVSAALGCSSASDPSSGSNGNPIDHASDHTSPRYVASVVSYTQAEGGGYGSDKLPTVVQGPPHGAGCCAGSTDVVSLGNGGEIVVGFDVDVVDRPGADFVVFENPFFVVASDPSSVFAEPGDVSVSEDGTTWTTFPCSSQSYPYEGCAGWHPVLATVDDPPRVDQPEAAGGDAFDLSTIGVARIRFVRIRDMNARRPACCGTAGFDLDAVAALHW